MAKKMADDIPKTTYNGSELIRAEVGINKDILTVVLKANGRYTTQQAEELVKIFLARGVK